MNGSIEQLKTELRGDAHGGEIADFLIASTRAQARYYLQEFIEEAAGLAAGADDFDHHDYVVGSAYEAFVDDIGFDVKTEAGAVVGELVLQLLEAEYLAMQGALTSDQ